ncbi:suppressor APC domain-containing protein 2-like [Ctenocephalides felis]|uniref:suppressor APC domain-containing protein 2-like n=1 Tax=Ctenocephalides felis TaxID=7515 RepID=UPI000E6E5823|nr:suppressor APC domain-containing protein 2-like [Ctenocephalides felis]
MRTLFDIMDDQKTGYVHLADIERRWRDDEAAVSQGLPRGVIESLRKVTPPSGKLSFERFCGGLKICLIRNQALQQQQKVGDHTNRNQEHPKQRSPSAPLLDMNDPISKSQWRGMQSHHSASALKNPTTSVMVRPLETPNTIAQHRALSLPQLQIHNRPGAVVQTKVQPIRPEKDSQKLDKAGIRNALHNWHKGLLVTANNQNNFGFASDDIIASKDPLRNRGLGDGQTDQQTSTTAGYFIKNTQEGGRKRREPRRHTLQSGIDHAALRRLKQLEQERSLLLRGLEAVDAAREWYRERVAAVQDGMRWLGRAGARVEQWSESHQERLEMQQARVMEANRHLEALVKTWERGAVPLHMDLELTKSQIEMSPRAQEQQKLLLERLKRQNRQLTEEVSRKSAAVTSLEREKAMLLRELMILQPRRSFQSGPRMMTAPPSNSEEEAVF